MKFNRPLKALSHFEGNAVDEHQQNILLSLNDYLTLVDYTGRIIRNDKRGAIPLHLPPVLKRLNLSQKEWLKNATQFESIYYKKFYRPSKRLKQTA